MAVFWHCHFVNTDGNKLVMYSGITLYYGDNYIIFDITGGRYDEMYIGQSPSPQQPGANIRTHKMGWVQNSILQNSILHVWE